MSINGRRGRFTGGEGRQAPGKKARATTSYSGKKKDRDFSITW